MSPKIFLARRRGIEPGEQRAFVMARVLERNYVVVVGSDCPDVVRGPKMIPAATMEEAIGLVQEMLGHSLEALVVPHALLQRFAKVSDYLSRRGGTSVSPPGGGGADQL